MGIIGTSSHLLEFQSWMKSMMDLVSVCTSGVISIKWIFKRALAGILRIGFYWQIILEPFQIKEYFLWVFTFMGNMWGKCLYNNNAISIITAYCVK